MDISEVELTAIADRAAKENPDIDRKELDLVLKKLAIEDRPLAEAIGLSKEMTDLVYATAYNMVQSGRYDDALPLFKFLVMMNGSELSYHIGVAKCYEGRNEWTLAVATYYMLIALDGLNPSIWWSLYLACEKAGNKEGAATAAAGLYFITDGVAGKEKINEMAERLLVHLADDWAGLEDDNPPSAEPVKKKKKKKVA